MDDEKLLQALTSPAAEDPDALVERVVVQGQASHMRTVVGEGVVDLFGRPIPAGTVVYPHEAARGRFRGTLVVGDQVSFRARMPGVREKFVVRHGMVLHIDLMRDFIFIYDPSGSDPGARMAPLPNVILASGEKKRYTHMVPYSDVVDATIGGPASYALVDVEEWLDGTVAQVWDRGNVR